MNTHDKIELPPPAQRIPYIGDVWTRDQVCAAIEADRLARSEPVTLEAERLAANRYRPVPDGVFAYKVVAGDGRRSLFSGSKDECYVVARKLTEAFLDGAFAATNSAPQPQQQARGEPVARAVIYDRQGRRQFQLNQLGTKAAAALTNGVHDLYTSPQPQQIPEGYKLVPVEPTAQGIAGGGIVEAVTKAILFEDCGSTEEWQDNLNLGEAALQAMVAHMPVEMGAAEWAELHILRAERGPADGVHKTWKDAAIAERCKRVLMTPRKEIIDLAKEGLGVYTGPNMNEHKICAEIVRLSAMLEAAPEPEDSDHG